MMDGAMMDGGVIFEEPTTGGLNNDLVTYVESAIDMGLVENKSETWPQLDLPCMGLFLFSITCPSTDPTSSLVKGHAESTASPLENYDAYQVCYCSILYIL